MEDHSVFCDLIHMRRKEFNPTTQWHFQTWLSLIVAGEVQLSEGGQQCCRVSLVDNPGGGLSALLTVCMLNGLIYLFILTGTAPLHEN